MLLLIILSFLFILILSIYRRYRIITIIIYDKKSYEKDCKAHEISSIDGNKIFSPVQNKSYSIEVARVLSVDYDTCERIASKSHSLYRKIRLEFEREFTKGIWNE